MKLKLKEWYKMCAYYDLSNQKTKIIPLFSLVFSFLRSTNLSLSLFLYLSLSLYIYIYIYICMCVCTYMCVCVCVCVFLPTEWEKSTKVSHDRIIMMILTGE